jgi:putative tricarboxylic transport membrane protein
MLEENLRRAIMISDGSLSFLWERPITATIMAITLLTLLAPVISTLRNRRAEKLKRIPAQIE